LRWQILKMDGTMHTRNLSGFLAALIALSVLAACSGMNGAGTPTAAPQTSAPVLEDNSVSASGEVIPQKWVNLSFPAGGQNLNIQVEAGQQVEGNKLLAAVDDLSARSTQDSANAQLAGANAQLASANAQLASANAQLASAKATLDRLEDIEASDRDIDSAKAAVAAAEAAVTAANETITAANESITAAQASVSLADQALENTKLISPYAGTIVEVNGHDGEVVSPGLPVIVLADFSTLQVKTTDMSEVDVARIHVGDTANVSFDALPSVSVTGKVAQIALKKSLSSGVYYAVTITLDEIPDNLRWGMSAFVVINVK
jgi:multidrug resistance efflux pump